MKTIATAALAILISTALLLAAAQSYAQNPAIGDKNARSPSVREISDAEITRRFRKIWFDEATKSGMMKNNYLGVLTWQNPFDVWITQEIMYEVKPDIVVETGTFRGGSAALWATFLQQVNPDGRVITIDIHDKRTDRAKNLPIVKERVTFLHGSSSGPEIVEQVRTAIGGKRSLFILDSAHTRKHVLSELRAYGEMVPIGSYIIVQDTLGRGAGLAVKDYLKETDNYVIDKSRERLLITNNFDGYLQRVK